MNPFLESLLITLLAVAAAAMAFRYIEKIRPIQPGLRFYRKEFFADLLFAVLNGGFVVPLLQLGLPWLSTQYVSRVIPYQAFAAAIQALPLAVQILLALMLIDFITYWRHRFTHYYAWPFHAVHHSAQEINWLTKYRGHPGDVFFAAIFTIAIMHVMGFGGLGFQIAVVVYYILDLCNHANFRFGFKGWLRYIIATPQFHRWHHAVEPEAINKNFCVMFACYDWLFGSFYCPSGQYPSAYGLSPRAQKNYPEKFTEQLAYPFRQLIRNFRKPAA